MGIFERLGLGAVLSFDSGTAQKHLKGTNALSEGLKRSLEGVGVQAKIAVGALSGLAVAGAGAALRGVLGSAIQFETGAAKIGTALGGDDFKRLPEINKQTDELSRNFGLATDALQESQFAALGSGVKINQLGGFMETASKLSVGGMADIRIAVGGLTDTLNAFGMDAGKYAGTIGNYFAVANVKGKASVEALAAGMGNVAPIFAQTGGKADEMFSLIATGSSILPNANAAITGLRQAIANIITPSENAKKASAALFGDEGFFSTAGVAKSGGMIPFLEKVAKATKGNVATMGHLFGSVEALGYVAAVTSKGGLSQIHDALAAMANKEALDEAFKKVASTAGFGLKRLEQIGLSISRTVGFAVLPIMNNALGPALDRLNSFAEELQGDSGWGKALKDVAKEVGDFVSTYVLPIIASTKEAFLTMDDIWKKRLIEIGAGVLAFSLVMVPLGGIAFVVATAFGALMSVIGAVGGALMALAAPPALAMFAALAAATVVVREHWEELKTAGMDFWTGLSSTFGDIGSTVMSDLLPPLMAVWEVLKGLFETILVEGGASSSTWAEIGSGFGTMVELLVKAAGWLINGLAMAFNLIAEVWLKPLIRSYKKIAGGFIDIITGATDMRTGVINILKGLAGVMTAPYRIAFKAITELVAMALRTAAGIIVDIPGVGQSVAEGLLEAAQGAEDSLGDFDKTLGIGPPAGDDEANKALNGIPDSVRANVEVNVPPAEVNVAVNPELCLDGEKVTKSQGAAMDLKNQRGKHQGKVYSPSERARIVRGVEIIPAGS